jgi:hypothetical protein
MQSDFQKNQMVVGELRGHLVYKQNPSLQNRLPIRITPQKASKVGDAYMIAHNTGEVLAHGTFGFIEEKEVDNEQFVKIYLAGVRKYAELGKAGAMVFEFIYKQMSGRDAKDRDTITISLVLAQEWNPKLNKATYYRGLNELLDKEFLFRCYASPDLYFVNVRFMFNGDRLVLAQSYRRKGTGKQAELPLDTPQAALPLEN